MLSFIPFPKTVSQPVASGEETEVIVSVDILKVGIFKAFRIQLNECYMLRPFDGKYQDIVLNAQRSPDMLVCLFLSY